MAFCPFPILCHTCRHVVVRVRRVALRLDWYAECGLGLHHHGGRAITCAQYEREPGSDDGPIRLAAPPRTVQERDPDPPMPVRDYSERPRYPELERRPAREWTRDRGTPDRGRTTPTVPESAASAPRARRPGRWRVVGVAT